MVAESGRSPTDRGNWLEKSGYQAWTQSSETRLFRGENESSRTFDYELFDPVTQRIPGEPEQFRGTGDIPIDSIQSLDDERAFKSFEIYTFGG